MDSKYFLASGKDEEKVRTFFEERQAGFKAANDLAEEFGGVAVSRGPFMCGVAFPDGAPEGWREIGRTGDRKPYYLPVRRSKQGKDRFDRIKQIRIPGASELHSKFSRDGGVWGNADPGGRGYSIHYMTAEIIDGKCVIHVPEKMEVSLPDSRELKKSEYWKLKETAQ